MVILLPKIPHACKTKTARMFLDTGASIFVNRSCAKETSHDAGVGNLQHAWHAKPFLMARRSSKFYIDILVILHTEGILTLICIK